ncbi:Ribonucleotide reductase large subunit [Chrysochromulina ericina virus CeV-01B]|uniref:Ribonucleoside-diphosphate reductase n=1 Tax=Chrysochromulina ericina virus CeV-01B TaxID=3070830 RepID=A0A0N9R0D3_9VIRU|nr:ribonucleotide reductase [Chrysochromulina ericina virus]ALH23125.1 Ribonucleotide reductase large subunit [Chrysochromulina ericina virus CeV-01B]
MEGIETKEMQVIKRCGNSESVSFDKILNRVKKIGSEHKLSINFSGLVIKVIDQLHDNISTSKIDELTAEQAASLSTKHPDYGLLASALVVSNLQKNTTDKFSEAMNKLYNFKDVNNAEVPLLSKQFITVVNSNTDFFNSLVDHKRDYLIDYFGFKTLERAYLMHINKKIIERPQYMWLRVAICLHENDLEKVKTTYNLMSQKYFTHATPTLFNAGTPRPQLSSCFLIAMESDSVDGIYNTLKECANISKWAGGIGLHIHNIRGTGSHIRGTNGTSNGIIPMLGVFNKTARYIDQCVVPETYIYTKNGAIEIQNIKNSDYIYNSKGDIEKVDNILEHPYDGDIFKIETTHSIHPLEITPQHPILVMVDQCKGTKFDIIKKRIMSYEKNNNIMDIFEKNPEQENQLFQWKEAEQLTYDDMPIYVIPTYSEDNKLTWEDCYMYGIILGDGCLSNQYTNGYISMHTVNKRNILDFCKNYFDKRYIQYVIDTNKNITRIRWNKTLNMPIRYSDIYDTNKEKYIASDWINLPIDKSKYIVKGLIDTDGCINREVVFDSTSYNLIENMRFLLLKMGIPTSGYKRDRVGEKHYTERGVIENKKISYTLRIPQTEDLCNLLEIEYTSKFFKFLRYKNLLFTRIKSIVKNHYQGTLYDLQLKNTHNYMIHNGIIHNGGGKRAGSFAMYIEPHHPDIEEFLDLKKNHGDEELRARDLFYALWISDLFMERVHTNSKWSLFCPDRTPGLSECYGDNYKKLYLKYESKNLFTKQINARDLWIKILDSQMETGTPYMLYKDAVNYKTNQQNLGTIKSSNLCVAPETLILTKNGQEKIEDLKDKETEVWNGKTFSKTTVYQTSESSELIEVHTSDGCILSCTKYHKFYIQIKYEKNKKGDIIDSEYVKIVEAKDLKEGMKIIKSEYPVIDNKEKVLEDAYSNGFFSGDGTYANITDNEIRLCSFKCSQNEQFCKRHIHNKKIENSELRNDNLCNAYSYEKKPHVTLYGEKIKLLENLSYISKGEIKNNKLNVTLVPTLEEKFFVPNNYCIKSKIDWFSGYCDADGSISRNGKNQSLQISSIHKEFLINIKLMLQTCGISSVVSLNMDKRKVYLPKNDGSNEYKEYDCKKLWRLLIASNQLQKLLELGFSPKRLIIEQCNYQRSANKFITISKVVDNNRVDKTYCFNEPIRHTGIFNGIITSQCTEICEYSNENETAVCNLASIGLSKFIKETPNPFTDVTVYSKKDCNWCVLMKSLLKKRGINYNEIILSSDEEFSEFKEKNNIETLPQLFDNGVLIGGYNKVEDILRDKFDYEKLHSVTKIVTENLNKIIDINFYPTEKTKRSNLNHRPIGIGVQGLADVFVLLDLPFESDEAKKININIFKTIYHASLQQSNQIAIDRKNDIEYLIDQYNVGNWTFKIEDDVCTEYNIYNVTDASITNAIKNDDIIDRLLNKCRPIRKEIENTWSNTKLCGSYSSFEGSPAYNGILQFDMWNRNPDTDSDINYDWNTLKHSIKEYGLRNSLLVAPMPTASTSQILGNNECFEPFTSNIYSRRTLAGEFIIVNKYLINDLINLGIWDDSIKNNIIQNKGSIQYIDTIPKRLKEKYKIVWEIPMKNLIDMSRDRGAYICQSQSLNLWMEDPTAKSLTNMHFYSWKQGLKTGIYYLRRKPRHQPQQFTIEPESKKPKRDVECDENGCTMCSG